MHKALKSFWNFATTDFCLTDSRKKEALNFIFELILQVAQQTETSVRLLFPRIKKYEALGLWILVLKWTVEKLHERKHNFLYCQLNFRATKPSTVSIQNNLIHSWKLVLSCLWRAFEILQRQTFVSQILEREHRFWLQILDFISCQQKYNLVSF